jgi:hypothetical protein
VSARPDLTIVGTTYRDTPRAIPPAPEGRPREYAGAGRSDERHPRYEGTSAAVTLSDTLSEVLICSGHPDRFDLSARTNPALFVLDDIDGRETDPIHVPVNTTLTVYIPRRRVRGKNAIAGSNAVVHVTAYYQAPPLRFDG